MIWTLLVAAFGASQVSATDSGLFGDSWNTTEWFWQSAVAVKDWLYVDGGEFYNLADLSQPNNVTFYSLASSLRIDLSSDWNNATVVGNWYGQNQFQDIRRPNLWYSPFDELVYRWGGWPYWSNETDELKLWHFPYLKNGSVSWVEDTLPTLNGLKKGSAAPFGPASVATETTFYSLGGANWTTDYAYAGLVEYNFASGTWSNESSKGATESGYYVFGQAAYAPNFGSAGFLIFVGGEIPSTQIWYYESGSDLADMSLIILYDIASGTWYHQQATGDIPPPRSEFCSVATSPLGDAAFEMFIYGGSTNQTWDQAHPDDTGYLNVYTLSIPAFRWFKAPGKSPVRRASHACEIIGQRQMLSIGGRQPSSLENLGVAADPWTNSLGVFDMTAFDWADLYNASAAPYEQPQIIQEYYSSAYKAPTWSDPVLASIFTYSPPSPTSQPSPTSHPTSTDHPTPTSRSSSSHTGAIVGGVVGGVCIIAIVVAGGYLILRRRRRAQKVPDPISDKEFVRDQGPYEADGRGRYFEADGQTRAEMESPFPELLGEEAPRIRRKPVGPAEIHELPGSTESSSQGGSSHTKAATEPSEGQTLDESNAES